MNINKKYLTLKIISLITLPSFAFFSSKIMLNCVPLVRTITQKAAIASAKLTLADDGELISTMVSQSSNNLLAATKNSSEIKPNDEAPQTPSNQAADGAPLITFPQEELSKFPQNNGPIIRKNYQAAQTEQYVNIGGSAYVRNMTKLPNQVILDANASSPAFTLTKGQEPQVLIYHTHTTESYELQEKDHYDANFPIRSKNHTISVVGVGNEITKCLQQAGIGVIHDTTIHDDPAYKGAYDRSKQTMIEAMKKHPSIKVAIDVHRDAIADDKGQRYAPIANINGRNASQIMIISGCDNGRMNYPNYAQNLAFACFLQRQIEQDYPSLTRPASFKYKYYNQSLTPGTLLVEFGGHANSVNEAMYAGWLFGKSLANALSKIRN